MNKHLKYGMIGLTCGFFGGIFWKIITAYKQYKTMESNPQFMKEIIEAANDLPTVVLSDSGMGLVTHEHSNVHYITIPIHCAERLKVIFNTKFNEEGQDIIDEFCNLVECYRETHPKTILHDIKPKLVKNREKMKMEKELEETIRDICNKMDMTFIESCLTNNEPSFEEKQRQFEKYYAERERHNMNKKESE